MGFYERYEKICIDRGVDPCSQKAADLLGVTRSTISLWHSKDTVPKGETVAIIANTFSVSADYLLGRTDDPTDHVTNDDSNIESVTLKMGENASHLFFKLDAVDQAKVEAYMQGLLAGDKYIDQNKKIAI